LTPTIDSGTLGLYIPDPYISIVNDSLPTSVYTDAAGNDYPLIPRDCASQPEYLRLGLGGYYGGSTTIEILISEFIIPSYNASHNNESYNNTTPYFDSNGQGLCLFTLYHGASETNTLLGGPLLRSTYLVQDFDHKTIPFAQASYKTNASHVIPIGPNGVQYLAGNGQAKLNDSGSSNGSLPPYISAASEGQDTVLLMTYAAMALVVSLGYI
jgi:hypothetical protein